MNICESNQHRQPAYQQKRRSRWITGLSVLFIFVALLYGLDPKDFDFSNNVRRILDTTGLRFRKYGIVYTDPIEVFSKKSNLEISELSIEIALRPSIVDNNFSFILVLYNENDRNQLLLGQWRSWIISMNGDDYDHKRRVKRISLDNALVPSKTKFISLTTGEGGTKLYINGQLADAEEDLTLRIPYGDNVRLILGNSPYGRHSWRGDIYGLAIYSHILKDEDVALHFESWSQGRDFSFAKDAQPLMLYYFDSQKGTRINDHSGANNPLKILPQMTILKKNYLILPWKRFKFDSKSYEDLIVNLVGFIPLGLVLSAMIVKAGLRHSVLITIAFCFMLSLSIEIAQAWLPSRSSDVIDLILNTFGAFLGTVVCRLILRNRHVISSN